MLRQLTVALMVFHCACATTATLSGGNGRQLEAEIERSDRDALYVRTESGADLKVSRSEIADVDHPGNVLAVIGAALSGYGALNIAGGAGNCDSYGPAYCAGVFLPAAVGVPMFLWGLAVWTRSHEAAANFGAPDPTRGVVAPTPSPFDTGAAIVPDQDSARALRARYRETREASERAPAPAPPERSNVAAGNASPEVSATGAFQTTRWGMSPSEVKALYPEGAAGEGDSLLVSKPVAGQPATLRFEFSAGRLTRVEVVFTTSGAADGAPVFARFRDLLGQKYGAPGTQSEGLAVWALPTSTIRLVRAAEADVRIVYQATASTPSVTDEI